MRPGFHAIVVHVTSGSLVLSFLALTIRLWLRSSNPRLARFAASVEPVNFYGALLGTVMLLLSIITGLLIWPLEASMNSPITANKMFAAAIAALAWSAFLGARLKAGPMLWNRHDFWSHFAYASALGGFIAVMVTSSIGGDLAGIPSGFEQVSQAFGLRTRYTIYFPTALNIALVIIGLLTLLLTIVSLRRKPAA